jgi:hypothetical protein
MATASAWFATGQYGLSEYGVIVSSVLPQIGGTSSGAGSRLRPDTAAVAQSAAAKPNLTGGSSSRPLK